MQLFLNNLFQDWSLDAGFDEICGRAHRRRFEESCHVNLSRGIDGVCGRFSCRWVLLGLESCKFEAFRVLRSWGTMQ